MIEGFLNIYNDNLYYRILNPDKITENKPVILFLHDGLGSVAQWKLFPQEISNISGCAAILYDRTGHGLSSGFTTQRNQYYLHNEADKIIPEILNQLKIRNKLIVFGHSDGGTLALIYGAKNTDKVIGIISEAHHVVVEEHSLNGLLKTQELYNSTDLKPRLEKYHGNNTDELFFTWLNTWMNIDPGWDIIDLLEDITCPVLSFQGVNDEYGTEFQLNILQQKCKGFVTTYLIPDCGHCPHAEATQFVIEKSLNFINQTFKNY